VTSLPIVAIAIPTLDATFGPFSVDNWASLDLTFNWTGFGPLLVTVEHDPDGLDAWQQCAALDYAHAAETADLHIVYTDDQGSPLPVSGSAPRVRVRLSSGALFTIATGSVQAS